MSSNESTISNNSIKASHFSKVRTMTGVAMLSAVAYVLMFFEFAVPLMPSFIKLDFSELPALIGGFAYGPAAGVAICLIKNIIHLLNTQTGGVGELSNFILGAVFVFISAAIYKKMHSKKGAILGATVGAAAMAAVSLVTNYYIVYPIYTVFMPMDAIIGAYQLILPSVKDLWQCFLVFNVPFTFIKGMCSVIVTVMVYKPLSPILKGNH